MSLRIGVDQDGVTYPFDRAMATYIAHKTNRPLSDFPVPDGWNMWEYWGMPEGEWVDHFHRGIADRYIFRHGDPYPGVVDAIGRLKAAGHQLHAVTDRGRGGLEQTAAESTHAWLAEHGISYDTVTFAADKTSVPTDVFIEDRPRNYRALREAGVDCYLIDQPWNRHVATAEGRRVADLADFADRILAATTAAV